MKTNQINEFAVIKREDTEVCVHWNKEITISKQMCILIQAEELHSHLLLNLNLNT